ncbi:MAG: TetR/AcrR family transcriptional regulator [Actinomycetota bacterium]|nr:TetR/AcrR family transcriptional regulator [Actinomycetota bacterium]
MPPADEAGDRRGRPRDARLDRDITDAALELLAESGVAGFSVAEVAGRSGVAKTTIYRRYPSRDALLAGALERLNDDLPDVPAPGPVRDRLVQVLDGIRRRSPNGTQGRLLGQVAATHDPRLGRMVYERVLVPRHRMLRRIVQDGIDAGELRADLDLDALIPILVGPMLYLRTWHRSPLAGRLSVEAVVDQLIDGMTRAKHS